MLEIGHHCLSFSLSSSDVEDHWSQVTKTNIITMKWTSFKYDENSQSATGDPKWANVGKMS